MIEELPLHRGDRFSWRHRLVLIFLASLALRCLYLQGLLPVLETRQTPSDSMLKCRRQ